MSSCGRKIPTAGGAFEEGVADGCNHHGCKLSISAAMQTLGAGLGGQESFMPASLWLLGPTASANAAGTESCRTPRCDGGCAQLPAGSLCTCGAGIPNRGAETWLTTSLAACPATLALRQLVWPIEPSFEGSGTTNEPRLLGSFHEASLASCCHGFTAEKAPAEPKLPQTPLFSSQGQG